MKIKLFILTITSFVLVGSAFGAATKTTYYAMQESTYNALQSALSSLDSKLFQATMDISKNNSAAKEAAKKNDLGGVAVANSDSVVSCSQFLKDALQLISNAKQNLGNSKSWTSTKVWTKASDWK